MEETGRCGSTERWGWGYDHCLTDFSGLDGHGPYEKRMDGRQGKCSRISPFLGAILFPFFFSILFFDLNPIIKDVRKSNHSCNLKSMEYVSNMLHMKNDLWASLLFFFSPILWENLFATKGSESFFFRWWSRRLLVFDENFICSGERVTFWW